MKAIKSQKGTAEYLITLILVAIIGAILVMVAGHNSTVTLGRSAAMLQGEDYDGSMGTQATQARTRSRSLRDFDDARIRQDQYSRSHDIKQSRKVRGWKPRKRED